MASKRINALETVSSFYNDEMMVIDGGRGTKSYTLSAFKEDVVSSAVYESKSSQSCEMFNFYTKDDPTTPITYNIMLSVNG